MIDDVPGLNQWFMQVCRTWFLSLFLILLAGCGSSLPATRNPTPSESSGIERNITLVFWHAWPSPDQHILATLVERYNQSHPRVQVIPQTMSLSSLTREVRTAALAGSGPHVVLLQNHTIGDLAQDGILLPLDNLVSPEDQAQLLPATLEGAHIQHADGTNHLYGLPVTFDTLAFFYSKASLDKPPSDMETVLDMAHRIHDTTTQPEWGLAYTLSLDKTIGYLDAFGGTVLDSQGRIVLGSEGRAGTERWLQWLLTLRQDQKILAVNDSILIDSTLNAHKASMTIDWAHTVPKYRNLWGDNLGIAVLPPTQADQQPPRPYVQSMVVCVNARVIDQYEQQAVLDFLHYLTSEESQTMLLEAGKQPARLSVNLEGETPAKEAARVFRAQAQHGQAMPKTPSSNAILQDELERMQLTVLRGLATPSDAVTHADTSLRERLASTTSTPEYQDTE